MIGHLRGEVLLSGEGRAIVATPGGVGHEVFFPGPLGVGERVSLYTTLVVRENEQSLYAFRRPEEKRLFEMLIKVKGVGPKSAASLLSALGAGVVLAAVRAEDKRALAKAPGVGPRAAAQIVLDLAPRVKRLAERFPEEAPRGASSPADEAVMACKELGLREERVAPVIERMARADPSLDPEELVRQALREM